MSLFGLNALNFLTSLTVEPDILLSQARAADSSINKMKNIFTELESIVNGTNSYWIGEAGDAHRQIYQGKKEEISDIFARLKEDVCDLQQMASLYAATENEVTEIANDLPADVII